jgi:hypothetical protein
MPERIATPPRPKSETSCSPAVPPPPVCGAPTGNWVAAGVAGCVARCVGDVRWVAEGVAVGVAEAVRLGVGESVADALRVADALAVADALPVAVADLDGEGVVDPLPEWVVAEI